MDQEEKQRIKEAWQKRRELDAYLDAEKIRMQAELPIEQIIAQFDSSFRYAMTLPHRESSGFVEWYQALAKVKKT